MDYNISLTVVDYAMLMTIVILIFIVIMIFAFRLKNKEIVDEKDEALEELSVYSVETAFSILIDILIQAVFKDIDTVKEHLGRYIVTYAEKGTDKLLSFHLSPKTLIVTWDQWDQLDDRAQLERYKCVFNIVGGVSMEEQLLYAQRVIQAMKKSGFILQKQEV